MLQRDDKGWIQTFTGKAFWPLDPRVEDVDIVDIAHALSNLCRYAGHTQVFYSVAEHCCHVSDHCPPQDKLWGLLHDATEAYLVDIPRPVKRSMGDYRRWEDRLEAVVALALGLSLPIPDSVHQLDSDILENERAQLHRTPPLDWKLTGRAIPGLVVKGWSPDRAEVEFLYRWRRLTGQVVFKQWTIGKGA